MRYLAIIAVLSFCGCATLFTAANKTLDKADSISDKLGDNAIALVNMKCKEMAISCIASGAEEPGQCPDWITCNDVRGKVGDMVIQLKRAVLAGQMALTANDAESAADAAAEANTVIAEIYGLLKAQGVL